MPPASDKGALLGGVPAFDACVGNVVAAGNPVATASVGTEVVPAIGKPDTYVTGIDPEAASIGAVIAIGPATDADNGDIDSGVSTLLEYPTPLKGALILPGPTTEVLSLASPPDGIEPSASCSLRRFFAGSDGSVSGDIIARSSSAPSSPRGADTLAVIGAFSGGCEGAATGGCTGAEVTVASAIVDAANEEGAGVAMATPCRSR